MRCLRRSVGLCDSQKPGFTLVEVVVSLALAALTFSGVMYGYAMTSDQAHWSSCSLAAHSLAVQGVEQARAAKWDPQAWPAIDELGTTSFSQVCTLDLPVTKGNTLYATNFVSVTTVSTVPPIRELRSDCVWKFMNGSKSRGLFTNTVVTLRAPDQ